MNCVVCNKSYIGSTIRQYHQWHKEHEDNKDGIIKKHILDTFYGDKQLELKIREGLRIKKDRRDLNTKEELNKLLERIL